MIRFRDETVIKVGHLFKVIKQRIRVWDGLAEDDSVQYPSMAGAHLYRLFGAKEFFALVELAEHDPAVVKKLEMLCGEHGYAVYRAMLINNEYC